ncbi:hypothetical protein ZWY2020_049518 [Hordeum vulgare]|nr:hypothetical protein ZWY2020_049518 [Hordeum vulgare]
MSWQTYVNEQLLCDIDGQRLAAAAILGHDGAVWAQSEPFPEVERAPELQKQINVVIVLCCPNCLDNRMK